ncbi:syntaxin-3-like [Pristis pectinata]|uniref:syntaxin-3-like n=1 Tax=Pristis pectinata TaxID=685728 RepID=UPI00223E2B81|nr:syntaxin-3-like [Pristis pectinata]
MKSIGFVSGSLLIDRKRLEKFQAPTMKDRLQELKKAAEDDFTEGIVGGIDNPTFAGTESNKLDGFFEDISAIFSNLNKLENLVHDIQKKQEEVLCGTANESIYNKKKTLKEAKCELIYEAKVIQSQLDRMKDVLFRKRREAPFSVEYRIRQYQYNALVTRYQQILTSHYTKETEYVAKLKQQILRQTELAGLQLQDEDVDRFVENLSAPQIVGQDLEILKAKEHLALAQERHKQLLDLESQIAELHELFLHFEVLVTEQQEIVNSIEYNVHHTVDYITQSSDYVKKAIKYQKKSRVSAAAAALLGLCVCIPCIAKMSS